MYSETTKRYFDAFNQGVEDAKLGLTRLSICNDSIEHDWYCRGRATIETASTTEPLPSSYVSANGSTPYTSPVESEGFCKSILF